MLFLGVPAFADLSATGPCLSSTPANGTVCKQWFYYNSSTASGQTSVSTAFTPVSYSDSLVLVTYVYDGAAPNISMTGAFGTNVNLPDTCFLTPPGNPYTINPGRLEASTTFGIAPS
jgi:hypothetical protein